MPILRGKALHQYRHERGSWNDDRPETMGARFRNVPCADYKLRGAEPRMARMDAMPKATRELIHEIGDAALEIMQTPAKPVQSKSLALIVEGLKAKPQIARRRVGL